MKIVVWKNHLGGQILYRSLDLLKNGVISNYWSACAALSKKESVFWFYKKILVFVRYNFFIIFKMLGLSVSPKNGVFALDKTKKFKIITIFNTALFAVCLALFTGLVSKAMVVTILVFLTKIFDFSLKFNFFIKISIFSKNSIYILIIIIRDNMA